MEVTKKKGQIEKTWKRWISKKGSPTKVELIEFVGISQRQGRYQHGRPKPHYFQGRAYIGEMWRAVEVDTGKETIVTFPHVLEDSVTSESIHVHRTDIAARLEPNILVDSLEEVTNNQVNRQKYPNRHLEKEQQKYNLRIDIIKELYEKDRSIGLFLLLRHKETPCLHTFNTLVKWRTENPERYTKMMDYISLEMRTRLEYEDVI